TTPTPRTSPPLSSRFPHTTLFRSLDMRVQPAILVDHDDTRPLIGLAGRRHEIAANRARALRRLDVDVARLDSRIVLGDPLPGREVGHEALEQRTRRHAADGERPGTIQELPTADVPVHELIEQLQYGRTEIAGSSS